MEDTDHYWVPAAPFHALLVRLLDLTGLPWLELAEHARVPPNVVRRLLYGDRDGRLRRIHRDHAARLLALDERRLCAIARVRYH